MSKKDLDNIAMINERIYASGGDYDDVRNYHNLDVLKVIEKARHNKWQKIKLYFSELLKKLL